MAPNKLTPAQSEQFATRVIDMYQNVYKKNKKKTWHHFKKEGHSKTTIYRHIRKFGDSKSVVFKKPSGRVPKVMTKTKIKAVEKYYKKNPSSTTTLAAQKLKLKVSTLKDIKINKLGIKARSKKSAPKHTPEQEKTASERLTPLYNKMLRKIVVMDDETYVLKDPSETPIRQFFHSSDPSKVPTNEKIKNKSKFPKKILIWQAVDQNGNVSEPFVHEGTMNSKMYLEECVKKRLIPFILEHHQMNQIIFWPDLATIHYANNVKNFLQSKMAIVDKLENPPNIPHLRPIERFWALCKRRYSDLKSQPDTIRKFQNRWKKISDEVGKTSGESLMKHLKKKILYEINNGIKSSLFANF